MKITLADGTIVPILWVKNYKACWWVHIGKYVLRIGKLWGRYRYASRPLVSFFRAYK